MKFSKQYKRLRDKLAQGWNTWNTKSLLSHVLLLEAFSINICIKRNTGINKLNEKQYLKNVYIQVYKRRKWNDIVKLGNRTYDGKYIDLTVKWYDIKFRVQSATMENNLLLLITPLDIPKEVPYLVVEAEMLWNKKGKISKTNNQLIAQMHEKCVIVGSTKDTINYELPIDIPYLSFKLDCPIGIYTNNNMNLEEISKIMVSRNKERKSESEKYGDLVDIYNAVQSVSAWNSIYDYENKRIITPVSRYWAGMFWGGYVLFPWDTYFAALMASLDNKELAYVNAIEITKEITPGGFVPCVSSSRGKSFDRSQPPVGSLIIRAIYNRYKEKWFLKEVYDELLEWNRWRPKQRANGKFLSWGSHHVEQKLNQFYNERIQSTEGAAFESGLDNSPMFDDVPFNKDKNVVELADVGLMSLYIADCEALADIATILEKYDDAVELKKRAEKYKAALATLWDEDLGIYLNYRTDINEKSYRLSPTLFFPMIVKLPSQEQAERMIKDHFFNREEFYGDWILPSIARNDPAFHDQNYWRGRVWAPFNFLIYLGLNNYNLPRAKAKLIEKSKNLLLKEYLTDGHIHENYNAITGEGDDIRTSDCYYNWGALLGFISLIEAGFFKIKDNND
ncbi:MAG: MGH1-like glycoside hydrolase domain-containing protein [Promethearchaeota archaeon]